MSGTADPLRFAALPPLPSEVTLDDLGLTKDEVVDVLVGVSSIPSIERLRPLDFDAHDFWDVETAHASLQRD